MIRKKGFAIGKEGFLNVSAGLVHAKGRFVNVLEDFVIEKRGSSSGNPGFVFGKIMSPFVGKISSYEKNQRFFWLTKLFFG